MSADDLQTLGQIKITCPARLRDPVTGECASNIKTDPVTGKVYIEPATQPWHAGYEPKPVWPWIVGGLAAFAAIVGVAVVATRKVEADQ